MNERNMTVNISGKQINIAKDNATIRAIQNNRIEEKQFIGELIKIMNIPIHKWTNFYEQVFE